MQNTDSSLTNGHKDGPLDITPIINGSGPRDSKGWDGKLRVERRAILTNPEALSDPEHSDEDAPPVDQIDADEGYWTLAMCLQG